jgi:hypothetical protein
MKYKEISISLLIPILIFWVTSINAFAFLGIDNSANWKEEVLLHDGRKIIMERSQTRGGLHEIGQDVPLNKHMISFKLPETSEQITWQTTIGRDIKDTELLPLALDIIKGIPYLVTIPMGCIAYNKWKRPNPPYVFLKYDGKNWNRISLEEFPPEIKGANMVIGALNLREEKKLTSI